MTGLRLIRSELRKLTSTWMPWVFLAVLVVIGGMNAAAVAFGTDMDGSKTFISTAADQQSLMAFAANAMMLAGLFGAIAVAREYAHGTVVPMFLAEPRRNRAVLAQFAAVSIGGGVLGFAGAALSAAAVALGLLATDFDFLVPAGGVARVLAASTYAGAAGALLGAGIGAIVRNSGGAVAGAVVVLVIAPPLVVQFSAEAASWIPNTLNTVVSGITDEVDVAAAVVALAAWAVVPAVVGLVAVGRRDVV